MSDSIEPMAGAQRSTSGDSQEQVSGEAGEIIGAFLIRDEQQRLAVDLVAQARATGANLVGPEGLMAQLTKRVLEAALEAEMVEHLGYEAHDPQGRNGRNSRNGKRSRTVLSGVGPVEIDVPRDREGSFEPVIVKKRQRRLGSID
ncbi:transposase [Kineosporia sp. J2-2]|uniref:Mutator family transposase n=1 Tax=Kineosporia corallincola TaxID=2835133 RepID=A0ABS5TI82_9ACTN|nr:transposase [Kineosporia corallincola]